MTQCIIPARHDPVPVKQADQVKASLMIASLLALFAVLAVSVVDILNAVGQHGTFLDHAVAQNESHAILTQEISALVIETR